MIIRDGVEYAPKCRPGQTFDINRGEIDMRGRSLRCAECLKIVVHPFGNTDLAYVHWTDLAPTGKPWMDYAIRNASNGRLIVPKNWEDKS